MNRIIVVTGAGRGLGYSIVRKHLALHDTVYALYNQSALPLTALAENGTTLKPIQCNVASDADVAHAAREIIAAEKRVDIIYNVVGINNLEKSRRGIAETDTDYCLELFNVNALGALRVCKYLFPLIQKGSAVIQISSESGSIGGARRTQEYGYCMSKAAMNMSGKLLSNELWAKDARVMIFHPGWLKTDMGGEGARQSNNALFPDESAGNIVNLVLNIDAIPRDQIFMTHAGELLPW
jgi:NAD(P)-dependent dehydrogenase (short-subunit alcohol dehydrogenase family)